MTMEELHLVLLTIMDKQMLSNTPKFREQNIDLNIRKIG